MKKLLIMILPMFLLFGVSFADTWTFDTFSPWYDSASVYRRCYTMFEIQWFSWNTINLYSIQQWDRPNVTCTQYAIQKVNTDWTLTLLTTGTFNNITWETIVDLDLSVWKYFSSVMLNNGATNCITARTNTQWYLSWFLYIWQSSYWYSALNTSIAMSNTHYTAWIEFFTFSWTDPRIATPTPITIHYNWTTTGYAGTELYIDQPVKETYMSWGFLHFIVQIFRTLFRVN